MKYLLDVNALIAWVADVHALHERVEYWVKSLRAEKEVSFLTCSLTELGFVRVLDQNPGYDFDVASARDTLARFIHDGPFSFAFVADDHGVDRLPIWVKTGKQTTDGHLLELAQAHDAMLATLDEAIPGAFVIPIGAATSR